MDVKHITQCLAQLNSSCYHYYYYLLLLLLPIIITTMTIPSWCHSGVPHHLYLFPAAPLHPERTEFCFLLFFFLL